MEDTKKAEEEGKSVRHERTAKKKRK